MDASEHNLAIGQDPLDHGRRLLGKVGLGGEKADAGHIEFFSATCLYRSPARQLLWKKSRHSTS